MGETGHYGLGLTAEFRGTRCYVVWGANLKGPLFFLGSWIDRIGRSAGSCDSGVARLVAWIGMLVCWSGVIRRKRRNCTPECGHARHKDDRRRYIPGVPCDQFAKERCASSPVVRRNRVETINTPRSTEDVTG